MVMVMATRGDFGLAFVPTTETRYDLPIPEKPFDGPIDIRLQNAEKGLIFILVDTTNMTSRREH